MNPFKNAGNWFRGLPHKKQYIEVITATLSVPVLLSVVYMNYLNIQEKRHKDTISLTPAPTQSVITIIREKDSGANRPPEPPITISEAECTPGIGQIDIVSPKDNETITTNPLGIDIEYKKGNNCSVVWSYRINEGSWSDYSDKDIQIYNLPSGKKTLELRVKSIVNGDEKTLERTFTYKNSQEVPTPTTTPTSTPTATPTITPTVTSAL